MRDFMMGLVLGWEWETKIAAACLLATAILLWGNFAHAQSVTGLGTGTQITATTFITLACPEGYVLVADPMLKPKCAKEPLIEPDWNK